MSIAGLPLFVGFATAIAHPTVRGRFQVTGGQALSLQSLPEDPIGTLALTLTNVVVGSAIQIQSQSGVSLHNSIAATSSVTINLQAYAPGSPLNDLVIKVRKGSSAPYFQPFLTQTLAISGAQSIFVSQIPDQ